MSEASDQTPEHDDAARRGYTRAFIETIFNRKHEPQPTDAACLDNLVSRLSESDGPQAPRQVVGLLIGAWHDGLRHERVRAAAQNRSGNTSPTWADVQGVFGDIDVGIYSLDDLYRVVGMFSGLYMHSLDRERKAESERDKAIDVMRRMAEKCRAIAQDTDGMLDDVADIYDEMAESLGMKPTVKDPIA
jgi:hypothetical protein